MEASLSSLVGQRQIRIEKTKKLKELGINPYPAKSKKDILSSEVKKNYEKYEGKKLTVTGRLMSWRELGHIIFGNIQDDSGKIQLYIKDEVMPKETKENKIGWNDFKLIDVGDHLQVSGEITKTKTGEISVLVDEVVMLSKAIRPLPEKWQGLQDIDERFRRRYLDMTMNPEIREMFKRRSLFWKAVREFLDDNGFYEVNIPVLENTTGGADARPFTTHFDALDQDFYLRISHELPLKRLLGGGFEKVYDLGPRFRNEGFSEEHLPEHIAMEFYWAYADRDMGMRFEQELFRYIAKKVYGKTKFNIKGFDIDLDKEWEVLDFGELMKEKFGIDIFEDSEERINDVLNKHNLNDGEKLNRSRAVDTLWKSIRGEIGGPAFLINIPKFFSPLAKADEKNPRITQRVQPLIAGSEMASSWAELNDPVDQLERFVEQQKLREGGDEEAQMMDIDFVEMLEYGMPPAFGFGMSERVFWFFENVTAREGVPFPPMKDEIPNDTKKVYKDILKYIEKGNIKKGKQDFSRKIVTVVDSKLGGWELLNTVSHLCSYLGNTEEKGDAVSTNAFTTKDGINIPANPEYPIIALKGFQSELHKLMETLLARKDVKYLIYTHDMVETSSDKKLLELISKQDKDELNILGIGILGRKDIVEELTKKFSLYK